MLKFEINDLKFRKATNDFLVASKRGYKEVLFKVGRGVADRAMKTLPPTVGSSLGSDAQQRKQGESAILRDLNAGTVDENKKWAGLFFVVGDDIDGHVRNGHVYLFTKPDGNTYLCKSENFLGKASINAMKQRHDAARSMKTGRVRVKKALTYRLRNGVYVVDRLVVCQSSFEEFLKYKKGFVGFGKAGFLKAYNYFGSLLKTGGRKAPAWIAKHRDAPGRVKDDTNLKNPMVMLSNDVEYVQNFGRERRIMRYAIEWMRRSLVRETKAIINSSWAKAFKGG